MWCAVRANALPTKPVKIVAAEKIMMDTRDRLEEVGKNIVPIKGTFCS